MPRVPLHALIWSTDRSCYELFRRGLHPRPKHGTGLDLVPARATSGLASRPAAPNYSGVQGAVCGPRRCAGQLSTAWARGDKIKSSLRELGIGFVPCSPLGAGFLTGTTRLAEGDFRTNNPRLRGENARQNAERFAPLHALAQEPGIPSAQLVQLG
jgi:hypothetical protein